jgi:hypothetical protein
VQQDHLTLNEVEHQHLQQHELEHHHEVEQHHLHELHEVEQHHLHEMAEFPRFQSVSTMNSHGVACRETFSPCQLRVLWESMKLSSK